jgi:hypothetical protein
MTVVRPRLVTSEELQAENPPRWCGARELLAHDPVLTGWAREGTVGKP